MRNIIIATVVLVLAFVLPAPAAIDQALVTNANVFVGSVGNGQSSVNAMINKLQQSSTNSQFGQQNYQELVNAGVLSGRNGSALGSVYSSNAQFQDIGNNFISQAAITGTNVGTQAMGNGSASVCVGKAGTQFGSAPGVQSADSTMVMVFSQSMASPSGCQSSPASAWNCVDISTMENAWVVGAPVCQPHNPCN